jgi:hypothetical protein
MPANPTNRVVAPKDLRPGDRVHAIDLATGEPIDEVILTVATNQRLRRYNRITFRETGREYRLGDGDLFLRASA